MKFTAYSKSTGQVLYGGTADDAAVLANETTDILVGVDHCDGWLDSSKTHHPVPEAPSPFHEWDWTTKQYVPKPNSAAADRLGLVNTERATRSKLPINYNAAPFDADTLARERISGTLARLLRGDGLPQGWMGWRDAINNMHWATDDAATVATHLAALSSAIENREQALLIAAWTHKYNISQLTTVEDILAYDVTAGWPE